MHPEAEDAYDQLEAVLRSNYTAVALHAVMKEVNGMTKGTHAQAFKCAVQANLLQDNCDRPQHLILRDVLFYLSIADFGIEVAPMDVEDGEVLSGQESDTGSVSTVSSRASTNTKKKSKVGLF